MEFRSKWVRFFEFMKIDEFQKSSFRAENPTWIYFLQFLKYCKYWIKIEFWKINPLENFVHCVFLRNLNWNSVQNYAVDKIFKWIHFPEWNFDPIFAVISRCFEWNSTNNSWIGSWVQWIILYQKGNLFLRGSFYHLYQFKHFIFRLFWSVHTDLFILSTRPDRPDDPERKNVRLYAKICSSWNIMICGKSLKSINLN